MCLAALWFVPVVSGAVSNDELLSRVERNFMRLEGEKYRPDRVFLTDEESGGWPGDTEGRTVLALVLEEAALGSKARYLDEIMRRLPSHLNERGYMGKVLTDKIDEQQLSGNGWLLRALCAYARLEKHPVLDVRPFVARLARNLFLPCRGKFASYPIEPGSRKDGGGASGTVLAETESGWRLSSDIGCAFIGLDGLVDAFALVGDPELKPIIEEMIVRFLQIDLVAIRAQTHASLTGLRALLRYDARRFRSEVEKRFDTYVRYGMTDRYENYNWFCRYDTWTEPCAIVDSLLLARQLYELTGSAAYADYEEKFLTALCAHQRDNGGFGLQQTFPKGTKHEPVERTYEAHWCCTMRGGAGLAAALLWRRNGGAAEERVPEPLFVMPAQPAAKDRTAAVFERRFTVGADVTSAVWRVTALGVFDVAVNCKSVGTDFLKPGYTECGKCRHEFSYDVLDLLKAGPGLTNVLSATVTPGWWCDQLIVSKKPNPWQQGEKVAFRGELTLRSAAGNVERIVTDERWLAAYAGPLKSAGIYEGEVYDARESVTGLRPAVRNDEFKGEIRPAAAKVVLRTDLTLKPVGAFRRELVPGEMLVLDFGQNCSAVPRFTVEGAAGTQLEIRFAEMLNEPGGDRRRGNDGPGGTPYLANLRSAYAGLKYTLKDGVQTYRPSFTYYGYRYVGVRTTAPVVFGSFESIPVSSVTPEMERGRIVTGDSRVNRLIANVRWGMLSNYLSIPTDCPQRDERFGWTADTQVFVDSAAYLADSYGFLMKYLDDLADTQRANGAYTYFAPNCRWRFDDRANACWADAGVIIPYRLWKRYGRTEPFARHWSEMLRYMDHLDAHGGHDNCENADWLSLEHLPAPDAMTQDEPYRKCLAAIYHIWDAMMMREMASALNDGVSAVRFARLERDLRSRFAENYIQADGTMLDRFKGQTMDAFALKLGLCRDEAARKLTRQDLIANFRTHGNCLQTGFIGTSVMLPTLTEEAKSPELAYTLLLQDKFPSWLYSVDQGATTIWERWNGYTKEKGFGPVSMNSFNHYAYGCVMEWLFAYAAGIRADPAVPGFRSLVLAPVTDRRLGWLDAEYDSPVGLVKSSWRYGPDGRLVWRFTVPEGASALVVSPIDGKRRTYSAGSYEIR